MSSEARKSDLIDVALAVHGETDRAILVSESGFREDAVWLPKSQIEIERGDRQDFVTITMPEWLALDKRLI
jgi:hypothetical protein